MSMPIPILAQKEYCTGCTACAAICPKDCITMTADENGFFFPLVNTEKCVSCGLCERICPIKTPLKMTENEPKAYAAYSKDETMRLNSSSGGVFTEIAKVVLQDGGAVYGASYNEHFEVVHVCVEDDTNLYKLRGAKYAQSDLRETFAEVKAKLEHGQRVLFSGTPCQIGGLKAYLHKEYENLIAVDFVCLCVPSPMVWREYVKYRSEQDANGELPVAINLRCKSTGWSNYTYSNRFEYADGTVNNTCNVKSLYMKLFGGGYISRVACANCQFKGYRRVSDLTIGDFWGVWDVAPEMDDNKGTSVVLLQTDKGTKLFDRISDKLIFKEVSLEEASLQNGAMLQPAHINSKRERALALIREGKLSQCDKFFIENRCSAIRRAKLIAGRILRKIGVLN